MPGGEAVNRVIERFSRVGCLPRLDAIDEQAAQALDAAKGGPKDVGRSAPGRHVGERPRAGIEPKVSAGDVRHRLGNRLFLRGSGW